jgi:hypothetical protein
MALKAGFSPAQYYQYLLSQTTAMTQFSIDHPSNPTRLEYLCHGSARAKADFPPRAFGFDTEGSFAVAAEFANMGSNM